MVNTYTLFSGWVMSDSVIHRLQHVRLPWPSLFPGACSNSCPLNRWCHPTISSSVIPFSSCLQSFPASRSFPMSQFLASDGQSVGVSASASVFPMTLQGWFPLELVGTNSLLASLLIFFHHHSLEVSVFWHSAFFIVQLSLPYMTTGEIIVLTIHHFCWQSEVSGF